MFILYILPIALYEGGKDVKVVGQKNSEMRKSPLGPPPMTCVCAH